MKQASIAVTLYVLVAALANGCSYVEVRPDGSQRIIGLVLLETDRAPGQSGGKRTRLRTVGISIATSARSLTATVGYSDSALTVVNRDSCVALTRDE